MTFGEAMAAAIEHESPLVGVYRENRQFSITVKGRHIQGYVDNPNDLIADDWEIFDLFEAGNGPRIKIG